jgi:peptidoglycan/LPS O-acetylase OafA/YrhL
MFLGYNFAYQLWYIPMYLLIILSYPIIKKYIKKDFIRLTFFIALAVIWEIVSNLNIPLIANNPYPLLFIYYFFIYEMGCLFHSKKYYCKSSKTVVLLYFAVLISLVMIKNTLVVRIISDLLLNPISTVFFYYLSVWLKNNKLLIMLGNYSFYIYLFHDPLILSVLSRYLLNHGLYRFGILAPLLAIASIAAITAVLALSSSRIYKRVLELFAKNEKQNSA